MRSGCALVAVLSLLVSLSAGPQTPARGQRRAAQRRPITAKDKSKSSVRVASRAPLVPLRTITIIIAVPKDASVIRNTKRLTQVVRGVVLKEGDLIKSSAAGNIDIRIGDIGTVRLKPRTTLQLAQLLQKGKQPADSSSTRLKLNDGTLLVRLRALKGQSRFVIDTPSATAAARGTSFLVEQTNNTALVAVKEGQVAVARPRTPQQELLVGAEQKALIKEELPSAPQPITEIEQKRLQELDELTKALDSETDQLIAQVDALIGRKQYDQAESVAQFAQERAWSRKNAVRAAARILRVHRERDGDLTPQIAPDSWAVITAYVAAADAAPADRKDIDQWEQAARRLIGEDAPSTWLIHFTAVRQRLTPPRYMAPERLTLVEQLIRTETDPLIGLYLRQFRGTCLWATGVHRQAYQQFKEIVDDPRSPRQLKLEAIIPLAEVANKIPEESVDYPPRKRYARMLVQLAQPPNTRERDIYLAVGYMATDQPLLAEPHARRVYSDPKSGGWKTVIGFNLPRTFHRLGNRDRTVYWGEYFLKHIPDASQNLVDNVRQWLKEARR